MKRVLVAAALGGLLLVGTPTLALSAQRNDTRAEKGADKGGDKGDRGGKSDRGDNGDRAHRGDRGDRGDHRGDRDGRHRHGHRHGDHDYYYDGYPYYGGGYGYPYHGGYYGDPYYGGGGYRSGPREGQVIVGGMAFNPPEVHSRPGAPVLWIFQDGDIPHTVTADNGSFDSGNKVNDEYRVRFDHPGTYSYHCAVHPEMKGKVIVH